MNIMITHVETVGSTNTLASELAAKGAPEGTVVLSDVQTEGRGRKGDRWFSRKGGLWFTLLLRPDVSTERSLLLPLLMGIAVHRAVERYGIQARIKLPNDVLVDGKKLCGILCENRIQESTIRYVVAGVGMNVMNDPPSMGVSLQQLMGGNPVPDPTTLLEAILEEFGREYDQFLHSDYFFGEEFDRLTGDP